MKIAARIQYSELCRQLGVKSIDGVVGSEGKPPEAATSIRLRSVHVVDDDAKEKLMELDQWDDEPELADDPVALAEFIAALLSGDVALARIFGDRAFQFEAMRNACEEALRAAPVRRAA